MHAVRLAKIAQDTHTVILLKVRGNCLARQDVVTGKAGFNLPEFFG